MTKFSASFGTIRTDPGSQLEEICESCSRSLFPRHRACIRSYMGLCSSNKPKHDLVAHYVSVVLLFKPRSNLWSNLSGNLWALLGMQPVTIGKGKLEN